jgi:hypothetical protein
MITCDELAVGLLFERDELGIRRSSDEKAELGGNNVDS